MFVYYTRHGKAFPKDIYIEIILSVEKYSIILVKDVI